MLFDIDWSFSRFCSFSRAYPGARVAVRVRFRTLLLRGTVERLSPCSPPSCAGSTCNRCKETPVGKSKSHLVVCETKERAARDEPSYIPSPTRLIIIGKIYYFGSTSRRTGKWWVVLNVETGVVGSISTSVNLRARHTHILPTHTRRSDLNQSHKPYSLALGLVLSS